jgi:hypothetical protein
VAAASAAVGVAKDVTMAETTTTALVHTGPKQPGTTWRQDMTRVAVLYRLTETRDDFGLTEIEMSPFLKPLVDGLLKEGFLKVDEKSLKYVLDEPGRKFLAKMVAATDLALRFEIFSGVGLGDELPPDIADPEHPGQVMAHCFDPRFREGAGTEDLRLAMFDYLNLHLSEKLEGKSIDLCTIVFLQKLGSGAFKKAGSEEFWMDIRDGELFDQIEAIVGSSYKWTDTDPDREIAKGCMLGLYEAGMTEVRKRAGDTCQQCSIPLALWDDAATAKGQKLDQCPGCEWVFGLEPKPDDGSGSQTEIQTETTVVEDCGWGCAYGYDPYPFFCPYDPFLDLLAFSILADPFYW